MREWNHAITKLDAMTSTVLVDLEISRAMIPNCSVSQLARLAIEWHRNDERLQVIERATDEWSIFDDISRMRRAIGTFFDVLETHLEKEYTDD